MREHMDSYRCALSTKFGDVELVVTSKDHICVHAGQQNPITINRVKIRFDLHLNEYGNGWEYARPTSNGKVSEHSGSVYHALYARRVDAHYPKDNVSFTTQEKLAGALLELVKEWAAKNTDALQEADRRSINNDLMRKEEKLAELNEKMAELQKEIAQLEEGLR